MSKDTSTVMKLVVELNSIDEDRMNREPWSCEQICKRAALALSLLQNELRAVIASNKKG